MRERSTTRGMQHGLSLVGFMFFIAVAALLAVLAMKVMPSVIEYAAIKKALAKAKEEAAAPSEIRNAFDRQATTGYIEAVSGKDLNVEKTEEGFDVSVAYQKKIELIGPASLVIEYVASTDGRRRMKKSE